MLLKRIIQNIAIVLVSTVLVLVIGESLLGLMGFPSEHQPKLAHPPNYSEVRENIEFRYNFKTNHLGLRDDEIGVQKSANEYRVYVAGDSFVEGFGVDKEVRFTDLLERRFSGSARRVHR
jgi:hypothetical protein